MKFESVLSHLRNELIIDDYGATVTANIIDNNDFVFKAIFNPNLSVDLEIDGIKKISVSKSQLELMISLIDQYNRFENNIPIELWFDLYKNHRLMSSRLRNCLKKCLVAYNEYKERSSKIKPRLTEIKDISYIEDLYIWENFRLLRDAGKKTFENLIEIRDDLKSRGFN